MFKQHWRQQPSRKKPKEIMELMCRTIAIITYSFDRSKASLQLYCIHRSVIAITRCSTCTSFLLSIILIFTIHSTFALDKVYFVVRNEKQQFIFHPKNINWPSLTVFLFPLLHCIDYYCWLLNCINWFCSIVECIETWSVMAKMVEWTNEGMRKKECFEFSTRRSAHLVLSYWRHWLLKAKLNERIRKQKIRIQFFLFLFLILNLFRIMHY